MIIIRNSSNLSCFHYPQIGKEVAHPLSTTQCAMWVAVTSTMAGTTMKMAKQEPYPDSL